MKCLLSGLSLFLLCQCSSLEKSVGLGASIGAAGGFTSAQLAHYNAKGNAVLALTGAAIGAVIGALLHKDKPEPPPVGVAAPTLPSLTKFKDTPPLKGAEKDVILVPDRIDGDTFEEEHRVFVIKKPAHWQLRDGSKTDSSEEEDPRNE